MKINHKLIIFTAFVAIFGFSINITYAQVEKPVAKCGNNFVTITGESRAYRCSIAETVACKVADSTAMEEAKSFACPSECSIKSEVSTIRENLSCSESVNSVTGLSVDRASCKVSASFNCSSETNNFENSTTSLEEVTAFSEDVVETEEISIVSKTSEPELKRAMSSFGRFIISLFR